MGAVNKGGEEFDDGVSIRDLVDGVLSILGNVDEKLPRQVGLRQCLHKTLCAPY
jgi:hypothetical protein